MNKMFSQGGKGSTGILTNKQAVARHFGVKQSEVVYFSVNVPLTGYKVIYDKELQRAYSLPADIGPGVTAVSLNKQAVLVHSAGTVDLGELAATRREFVNLSDSFVTGLVVNTRNEILFHSGIGYTYLGELPVTITSGINPVGNADWKPQIDPDLRAELASNTGAELIGLLNGTVADVSQFVTPEQFYANHPGETDWAVMIQDAYNYAYENNKTVWLPNVYRVKSSIKHLAGLSVLQTGVIWADPTGDFQTVDAAGNSYKAVYHIMSPTTTYSDKRTYIPRIHIRHTQNTDWGTVYYQHVDAIGVLMTHIAGVTVGQMETWGMLRGGANIGGIPKLGYEICIMKSCFGIMRWTDVSSVGLDIRVGDSFFAAPVCIDYPIGIQIDGSGANTLVDPHPWGHPKTADNLYPNRQMLIGFHIVNGNNTLYRPYADGVAKLDPSVGATMTNGGYGFVIRSSKNVITDAIVGSHVDQVVTGDLPFFAAFFVGSVGGNKFELRDLQHKTTHFSAQPISWEEATHPTIPFRNKWIGNRSALQNNMALTGSIALNGTGITQSGTYTLRQIGDDVHLTCEISITAAAAATTDNLSITLPRSMGFYPGAMIEVEDRYAVSKGLTAPTCRVIGVVLPNDFTRIVLYGERADGTRFNLNSSHTQVGSLKFRIIGRLSNGM